ncbi:hypothetical protein Trydic_g14055 [Trypoxylus dichotomus]
MIAEKFTFFLFILLWHPIKNQHSQFTDKMEEEENNRCRPIGIFLCGRIGLFVLVIGYAFLGALIFKTLEGGNVENVPVHIQRSREDCLRELWLITGPYNKLSSCGHVYRSTCYNYLAISKPLTIRQ